MRPSLAFREAMHSILRHTQRKQAHAIMGARFQENDMATIDDRIATLEAKLKEEKAKKQKLEARKKAAESKRKRADDTRRKILIGSIVLSRVESGRWPKEKLIAMLNEHLSREDDRKLFQLDPQLLP